MLLLISNNNTREPRLQISEDPTTQQVFGIDVDGLKPGQTATVDAGAFGYPVRSISQLKPGEYWVQALLHVYETFKRKDGHTVKLPMDRGEGQQWSSAPGNLYSTPVKLTIDPGKDASIKITLDKIIPPIEPPKDTKYIKHVVIQSKLLTEFWGRPMHIGAHVLFPKALTNIRTRVTRWRFSTDIFRRTSETFARRRPIQISNLTTASASNSKVTTASFRNTLISFTKNGPGRTFPAC